MNSAQAALRVICFHSSFSTEPKHFESTENTAASSIISRSLLSLVAVIRSSTSHIPRLPRGRSHHARYIAPKRLRGDRGRRANDALVDDLLRDILPIDELDGAVGALLCAAAAGDALRGHAGLGVDAGHVPGASLAAHAAADALLGVDRAGTGLLIGVDGVDRAVLHALRVGALLAVLDGELDVYKRQQ